jgi:glycosyltransferase involved in cell wall biosynthesis
VAHDPAASGDGRASLILVAGKDPLEETGGGHSSLVRAWAHAAAAEGWMPHLFCASRSAGVVETPYGIIHRARSPLWFMPDPNHRGFPTHSIGFHLRSLSQAVLRFAAARPAGERALLHGFGHWAAAATRPARRMRATGREVRCFVTCYDTIDHEFGERWRGMGRHCGPWHRLRMGWEMARLRLCLDRVEGEALRAADDGLLHYESVARLVRARWGDGIALRRLPYTCEPAFRPASPPPTAVPAEIAALRPAGAPLLLSVSRHDERKGLDTFLRALRLLRDRGIPFRAALAGGGGLLRVHRRLLSDFALGDSTVIAGYVADLDPYWRAADVFVLPSYAEGSGSLSLLEAMRHGKASVASNVDGLPEDVTDGRDGLLVPPRDAAALARALERLAGDAALRGRLGAAARETFAARFSPDAVRRAIRDLYGAAPGGG